ncbi:hypothetical protein DP067_04140 [Mycoplasmopsis anatis]|uniref:Inhibitor of apoptosis-promoting Bax1 n=1 Tax=Mycoplasmopsis anatis 1340 TaxID=1034808 RepID=F9QCK2_9BACT|nr:hypothetical protein [Mycoplasmopsis anatis]AWX70511.1 hypothetical protein DP067_04140 [Mycoplasmopsis anatis]EGS29536.1 hypothetical protein GIG_00792 [Mycoplasmopsis anatis 1340]VEU73824.1 Uncharacterised protein [Mycoplasmopsis anatis]
MNELSYGITKKKTKNSYLSLTLIFVGIGLFIFGTLVLSLGIFSKQVTYFILNNFSSSTFFITYLISTIVFFVWLILFSYLYKKLPFPVLVIGYIFTIIYMAFITFISMVANGISTERLWLIALIFLVSVILTIACGIVGYFELIKVKVMSILSIILLFGFLVLFIVSLFVFNSTLEMIYSLVGLAISGINIFFSFYIISKKNTMFEFNSTKDMLKDAISDAVKVFINIVYMIWYLLRLFGSRN